MPMFQMRAVLAAIIVNEEEKKLVVDLIERDLRATGYPAEQISSFLGELIAAAAPAVGQAGMDQSVQSTRRLRNPFALGFEAGDENAGEAAKPPRGLTGVVQFAPAPPAPRPVTGTATYRAPPISFEPAPPATPGAPSPAPGPAPAAPVQPGQSPRATQPTPAAGVRRTTMNFDPPRPGVTAPPAGTPPKAAEPTAPVGTQEWRQQMAFGKTMVSGGRERRPLVLIADDDKRIRMIFRLRVEEAGMSVVECGTGDEAWQRIQEGGLSLVVLDMKMPGLHGLEVLSAMADKQISLPIVVCSAYDQLQDEFVIRTHPHLKYLVKPVAPEALVAAIRELLAQKPA